MCDICLEFKWPDGETEVTALLVKRATENGFVPKLYIEPAMELRLPSYSPAEEWTKALNSSTKNYWSLCADCYTTVKQYSRFNLSDQGDKRYDTFLSYASEDSSYANQVVGGLMLRGVKVWYAPITLGVGDKLLADIEKGLRESRTGTLIVSPAFLMKEWTEFELDILLRQFVERKKPLLQIWHNVTKKEIEAKYMSLTGLLAVNSSDGMRRVVDAIGSAATQFAPLRATIPLWESPRHRFLSGEGEIQLQETGGTTVSIFELLVNFSKEDFPLNLDGELFSRRDLALHVKTILSNDPMKAMCWTQNVDKLTEVCREEGVKV